MTTCIIAEKPSVARDIARIVGATHQQDGFIEGKDYLVTWAFGHLITLALPEHYGLGTYKADALTSLPMQAENESSSAATSTPTSPAKSPSDGYGSPPSPTRQFGRDSQSSNLGSSMMHSTRQEKLVARQTGSSASMPAERSR